VRRQKSDLFTNRKEYFSASVPLYILHEFGTITGKKVGSKKYV